MKVPFLDLKTQYLSIKKDVNEAFNDILENTAFIGGKYVSEFENKFSKAHDSKHTISCANGTDAIYIALKSLGISYGDEVITAANTFIATAEPITHCGAKPVFVDVDDYFHLDPSKIKEKITSKTKAIIAVHLYGQTCDMAAISEVAAENGLYLIEDSSQAHLAEFDAKKVGKYSDFGTFSFYPGKNLGAYGDAGALITDDPELARKARIFANHGSEVKQIHTVEGINSRMDALQAAVLNIKMDYLSDWTQMRQKNADLYDKYLSGIKEIEIPKRREKATHVFHLYVIKTNDRDQLGEFLKSKGVAWGIHYAYALPYMHAYSYLEHAQEDFPRARKEMDQILSLPMFPELKEEQIKYVAECIKEFYKDGN